MIQKESSNDSLSMHVTLHFHLRWDSHLPTKNCFVPFNESPWKVADNAFYFPISSFRSQDIWIFVLTKIVAPPHFVYDLSRKMFFMLHSINWPNFIVWFPLLLRYCAICIAIDCFPSFDVTYFGINLIFLIKSFFYMTKKSRQIFKYLENESSF